MRRNLGYAVVWALAFWLLFGAVACDEPITEVHVMHSDSVRVDTAFVFVPGDIVFVTDTVFVHDTTFVHGCPQGYHWHERQLRCRKDHDH